MQVHDIPGLLSLFPVPAEKFPVNLRREIARNILKLRMDLRSNLAKKLRNYDFSLLFPVAGNFGPNQSA